MKTYQYLKIFAGGDLQVYSTDGDTLQWLIEEVEKNFPAKNKHETSWKREFQGRVDKIRINRDKINEDSFQLWAMGLLGKHGWEPFTVSTSGSQTWYHFRLVMNIE